MLGVESAGPVDHGPARCQRLAGALDQTGIGSPRETGGCEVRSRALGPDPERWKRTGTPGCARSLTLRLRPAGGRPMSMYWATTSCM